MITWVTSPRKQNLCKDMCNWSTICSGARFTNGFSIAIRIRWKFRFTLTSILIQWSLQNLYMARQLCCRGMCKNLLRSDGQQQSYGKAKFPSNLNCGQKIFLVKRDPVPDYQAISETISDWLRSTHISKLQIPFVCWAFIYQTVGRFTTKSCEISDPRDIALEWNPDTYNL